MTNRYTFGSNNTRFPPGVRGKLFYLICALVASLWFPTAVEAQFLPSQSKNRMVCEDVNSLRSMISNLGNEKDIDNQNYSGRHENCYWRPGSGYFTEAEIGKPLGWLFINPSYIAAIHIISVDNKALLHVSVVKSQSMWRMAPRCDWLRKSVLLANGEKQNLFGTRGDGIVPDCIDLVSPQRKSVVIGSNNNDGGSPSGRGSNTSSQSPQSQSCSNARWTGVISNIADLFDCDATRAIQFMSQGQDAHFSIDNIAFTDGVFIGLMSQQPSRLSKGVERMQKNFNWNDWTDVTQNQRSFRFQCKFLANADGRLKEGATIITKMKLKTYSGNTGLFECG